MTAQPVRRYEVTDFEAISERPSFSMSSDVSWCAHQAYRILHFGFAAAPIIAGADKFTHYLSQWDHYLAPVFPQMLEISSRNFMMGVGVIEIIAGIGVALKPRIFSYVVAGWLGGIIVNLLMTGIYFDIALCDFGLSLGALALGRLSAGFERRQFNSV